MKKRGTGQVEFAFWVSLIVAIIGVVLIPFYPISLVGSLSTLLPLAIICAVAGAGVWVAQYTAQHHIDAGVTSMVMNICTPVSIAIATLFLQEALTSQQMLGTLLLLIAIVLISKKHHLGHLRFDRYFMMMVASGVMMGVVLSAERGLMKTTGVSAGVLISWWAQCLGLGVATLFSKKRTNYTPSEVLTTGGLRALQSLSWVILLAIVGNLSVVSSVTTFRVVVIFVAAALLLGEREDLSRKIFGSLVAVAGLLLMK